MFPGKIPVTLLITTFFERKIDAKSIKTKQIQIKVN